jgi:hypothetical protein
MAETTQRSRAKRTQAKPDRTEETPEEATTEETAENGEAQEHEQPQGEGTGSEIVVPGPADPDPAGPSDAGEAVEDLTEPIEKSLLLSSSDALRSYDPAVVRGVLKDAPDPISIADARKLIEDFLTGVVALNPDDEEA